MIFSREGIRDQNRHAAEKGHFAQTRSAGSRNDDIGSRVDFLHPIMKRRDEGGYTLFLVTVIDVLMVLSSGQMNELDRFHGEMRKRGRDGFVDAVRALATADDRHGLQIRVKLQQLSGLRFLELRFHALSDRR